MLLEIQVEIMKRLPVKSLIQLRSVSKTWKSLIDSSEFVAEYSCQHTQMQHILVRYDDLAGHKQRYVSIVDDDTFPQHRVSLPPPVLTRMYGDYAIIGYSHGLFCFYLDGHDGSGKALLWNPSIRKTADVIVPNVAYRNAYETVLGFGVCRRTNDPKIVKITHSVGWSDIDNAGCIPWQVEVFTLSTRAWRSLGSNLPRKSVRLHLRRVNDCSVFIDGVIYWFATDMDGGSCNLIISFDMASEEFGQVNLPNRLAHPQPGHWFSMFELRESLVVLDNVQEANGLVYDVWMMVGGVPKSFSKRSTYNFNTQDYASAMGFTKSGEHIIEILELAMVDCVHLVVYEPHLKRIENLGIYAEYYTFFVHPYMETLTLLDWPTVHNELETQIKGTEDRTMGSTSVFA